MKGRAFIKAAGAVFALAALSGTAPLASQEAGHARPAPQAGVSIIALGTAGGPPPHEGRAQPSTLLLVDGKKYLIDAGEAAGYQLLQARIPPRALDAIFITHLHWDHTLGLDYLMATEWMRGRSKQLPVYGPVGLDFLMSRLLAAVEVGEQIFRAQADDRPSLAGLYPSREVRGCDRSEVLDDGFVKVTAICNSHFTEVKAPAHSYGEDTALSYRFDTKYGSVTFTGDTGPSKDLEALAKGTDILVSEVVDLLTIEQALKAANPGADNTTLMQHMAHQHLTPEEVGRLATRAGAKKVILTHYVVGRGVDLDELARRTRTEFSGEVVAARDLQTFTLAPR